MQYAVKVAMFYGSSQFFHALVELQDKLVLGTARCNRLVASNLNLEFSFNGEKQLIANGTELLTKAVEAAKDGLFTKEDADFAVAQLQRIGLVYNSVRTLFHVQVDESKTQESPAQSNADIVEHSPVVSDDQAKSEEKSSETPEEISAESLTSDSDVANIVEAEQKAPAKRGRKASK